MMRLSSLPQMVRDANRALEIVRKLGKYGLADWIRRLDLDFAKGLLTSAGGERLADLPVEQRIRLALTELGPTFIKLGQMLSTRADLVGPGLADELSRLQTQVPPDPPEHVLATLQEEFGRTPEEMFAAFDLRPLGSASIGQVHRARLHDGREVVVKIRHAGIDAKVKIDTDILLMLADLAENVPELKLYSPKRTAQEFQRTILRELDFSRERRHLDEFGRVFADEEKVHFPIAYPEFSTSRVLTMEYLAGTRISDFEALRIQGHSLPELARTGADVFLRMMFVERLYHADPHPGNLLVLPDGRLGVLDCGMAALLDEPLVDRLLDLLLAMRDGDVTALAETVATMGQAPPNLDESLLQADLGDLVMYHAKVPLSELRISAVLHEVSEILRTHRIRLPGNAAFLIRTLAILEGTARKLDPNINLTELLTPYLAKLQRRRFSVQRRWRRLRRVASAWDGLSESFPIHAGELLKRLHKGRLEVRLEHGGLEPTINRLVWGLLTGSLILGSAILWGWKAPPTLHEYSVPGLIGTGLSLVLGLRLWRAISQSGHLDRPYNALMQDE